MSIAKIIAPLAGVETDKIAVETALSLAKRFNAHADMLFLRPLAEDMVPMVGEAMTGVWMEQFMEAMKEDIDKRLKVSFDCYQKAIADTGIDEVNAPPSKPQPSTRFREVTGRAERIAEEAQLADLVVFGPTARDTNSQNYLAMEAALMSSGRAVLLLPDNPPATVGHTIAVAWDGSLASARAVRLSLPLVDDAGRIHVLTAGTDRDAQTENAALVEYFRWHNKDVSGEHFDPGDHGVAQALIDHAESAKADLLVIGGFGHSRLQQMIFGGVTRHIMSHCDIPVLLAH